MAGQKLKENSITEGVIWKQLLLFFFPILIGTFFQQLYNTVDTVIVGQYVGKQALAAVGTTGTIINLLVGFFVGVSSGATVIISQFSVPETGKTCPGPCIPLWRWHWRAAGLSWWSAC